MNSIRVLAATVITLVAFGAQAAPKKAPLLIPVSADEPLYVAPKKTKASSMKPVTSAATKAVASKEETAKPQAAVNYKERHLTALDRAFANDTKGALAILKSLAETQMPAEELDRVNLSMGRIEYQAGNDHAAIEAYKKVRRGSASWLEALEERAWAHMRMGQPEEALASLKTVLTPLFESRTLSEPYFLAALAQLRICDYKGVFRTLDLFKTRFRTKVRDWEQSKTDSVAQLRLRETSETIQKLNLVEAEAIQRLYVDEAGERQGGKPPKIARGSDQLSFPTNSEMDSKEVWLDEVDDYRVTVKGCPQTSAGSDQTSKKAGTL